MKHSARIACLAIWVGVSGLAGPKISECFPAETLAVIRLDARKLRLMPLVMSILEAKTKGYDLFVTNIQTWTGLDLDATTICWVGAAENDRVVIALEGNFDTEALRNRIPLIDTAQVVHRENALLAVMLAEDNKPGAFNLGIVVNSKLILFGNPEMVDSFFAVYSGHDVGMPAPRAAIVKSMLPASSAVQVALLRMPDSALAENPWLDLITGGVLHADMEDQLDLRVSITARKPDMVPAAKQLIEGFRDLYRLLDEEQRKLDPRLETILENLRVEVAGKNLNLAVKLDAAVVESVARQTLGY